MFIKLTSSVDSTNEIKETILIRPEEIAAIESYKNNEHESIVYLRGNSEPMYVTQNQSEVYQLILEHIVSKSINKGLEQ